MSEILKNRIRQFTEEIWHKGNLDAIEEFIAPDYVRHTSQFREGGRDVHGPDDARKSIAALRAVFPDIHFDLEDILAEGDKVVARWTCTGTHRGEFRGIAATGKRVTFPGMNIYRLRDGKIMERWGVEDGLGLLQQLGAPIPGTQSAR
jgi:steroid delta-isomerase-like uncharacterized protein